MKKFFILCLMAFVMCVNANAQDIPNEELHNKIAELVICNYSIDDVSKKIESEYEIVYETNMDSQTMYKNLMTLLYIYENTFINEVDGMYQIRVKVDDDFWYDIYLKDNKVKIKGRLYSYNVYKNFAYSKNLGETYIYHIYRTHIVNCIVRIVGGYTHLFDF